MANVNDFPEWLQSELDKRGWKQADLVRRSHINGGLLSQVLSGQRRPGMEFCKGIALGLGLSDIEVLRRSGLTDEKPKFGPIVESAATMLNDLGEEDQEEVRAIVRLKWERKQRRLVANRHE